MRILRVDARNVEVLRSDADFKLITWGESNPALEGEAETSKTI